jgi:hypothetical protein
LIAFSSVFQRSSWKLDQLTPTAWAMANEPAAASAAPAISLRVAFIRVVSFGVAFERRAFNWMSTTSRLNIP